MSAKPLFIPAIQTLAGAFGSLCLSFSGTFSAQCLTLFAQFTVRYIVVVHLWPFLGDFLTDYMNRRIRTPKYGRTREHVFEVIATIKLIAIEIAATIVFLVWLYRELVHELH